MSNCQSPKQVTLAECCSAAGMAFFRFDHRGCGRSEGLFNTDTTFQGRCNDLSSALQKMRSMGFARDRIGLFGSSLGGAVCLALAGIEHIMAVVTFATPYQSDFANHFHGSVDLSFDLSDTICGISNIHIFHGDRDAVVPLSHARFIYDKVGDPKKLTIQKKGDHRMSDKSHQAVFARKVVEWFNLHLSQT